MAENSFIMNAKERVGQIERKNHYISNILLMATFSLIILFTLLSGVNVNLGSKYKGDGDDVWVRQSYFQLADVMLNSTLNRIDAYEYVEQVNQKLNSYGILQPSTGVEEENAVHPFHSLDFSELAKEAQSKMKGDVSSINWIKYKYALSVVIADHSSDIHKASWDGHVAIMVAGQSIFEALARTAIILISLAMLVFATLSFIKKKKFMRGKFSLVLLLVCFFALSIFNFGFIKSDACTIIVMILIPLSAILYALLEHALLSKREFSFTQFIYNAVMLVGSILVFIFLILPAYRVIDADGVSMNYGWNFLFDLLLGEGAYMAVPMSYFLQAFIMSGLLMLHIVLCAIMVISSMFRFMAANYQHNDKKASLWAIGIYTFIISLLIIVSSASGSLKITSLDLIARVNYFLVILPIIFVGGLLAFAFIYKPKPIKKELALSAKGTVIKEEDDKKPEENKLEENKPEENQ